MSDAEKAGAFLWHPKNVVEGEGRIIWSTTWGAVGYVAPGGATTLSEAVAREWARTIDALIKRSKAR